MYKTGRKIAIRGKSDNIITLFSFPISVPKHRKICITIDNICSEIGVGIGIENFRKQAALMPPLAK
jgi:hypothetical protein